MYTRGGRRPRFRRPTQASRPQPLVGTVLTTLDETPIHRLKLLAALSAVYFGWGSTFLATRYAVETLPPLTITAVRALIAGIILFALYYRNAGMPSRLQWRSAWIGGTLLFLGGQATMTRAMTLVPSGLSALILTSMALWLVLLHWLQPSGRAPTRREGVGLVVSTVGMVILLAPSATDAVSVNPVGAAMLLAAAFCWALGSLYSRGAPLPRSAGMGTAAQLITGGLMVLIAAVVVGEPAQIDAAAFTPRTVFSLAYLIILGTLIGFSAYSWLLQNAPTPALLGSYAYINPMVAMLLGWAVGGEALSGRTLGAMVVVVVGVALVVTKRRPPRALPVPTVAPQP